MGRWPTRTRPRLLAEIATSSSSSPTTGTIGRDSGSPQHPRAERRGQAGSVSMVDQQSSTASCSRGGPPRTMPDQSVGRLKPGHRGEGAPVRGFADLTTPSSVPPRRFAEIITRTWGARRVLVEVGSGTGFHAVGFGMGVAGRGCRPGKTWKCAHVLRQSPTMRRCATYREGACHGLHDRCPKWGGPAGSAWREPARRDRGRSVATQAVFAAIDGDAAPWATLDDRVAHRRAPVLCTSANWTLASGASKASAQRHPHRNRTTCGRSRRMTRQRSPRSLTA